MDQEGELTRLLEQVVRAGGRHLLNRGIDRLTHIYNQADSQSQSIMSAGSKRRLDSESSSFDMHDSPIFGTSTATSLVSQGGNLTLENAAGVPLMDNLENLHRHESHWEKEIYIETIYKCHGDNTSQYPYYIPWESINCCHSIEVLMDKFYNVSAWKPIKAEVWIENGRSWITEQPTNSNLNRKDIADYPLQIFLAGPEAPLNLAIFQSITDHDAWVNYKLPSDINTFPGITRRIYTGFTGFNANDISDNDPAWHQKVLGKKPATAYWAWDHGPHLDSPWRLTPEVFLTYVNQPQWAAGENPFEHNIHWLIDNRGQHYTTLCGLPRFDYVDGKVLKPKMDGRNIKEVKELSNQFTPIPSVIQIAYEQDILPCNSFKSLYYNMIRLGAGTAINEDIYQGCPLCKKFSKPPKLNFFLKFFYQILILF